MRLYQEFQEPALYGVNLRLRKPMIGLVLGGFIGGSVAGFMGAKAFSMGYSSILGVVIFEKKRLSAIIAGVIVSFLVSFIVTFVLFNGKKQSDMLGFGKRKSVSTRKYCSRCQWTDYPH